MSAIVTASNPRLTESSVTDGIDVDVTYSVEGQQFTGTVTLVPGHDGRLRADWAQGPDEWISRSLLRGITGSASEVRAALSAIEGEAAAVAEAR